MTHPNFPKLKVLFCGVKKKGIELRKANILHYCNRRNIKWMNSYIVTQFLKKRSKYTFWQAFKYYWQHKLSGDLLFAIYLDNKHIGNCGLYQLNKGKAELRFMIGETRLWGKGIGKIALLKLLSLAKSYTLKVIWLYVNPENKRAVNLYQNNGFKFVNLIKLPDTPLQTKMIKKIN